MTGAVFNTDVAEHLGQAGSIPVRLRQRPPSVPAGGGAAAMADPRRLVPLPVFKTGVTRDPGQAGSIPVRLRQPSPTTWTDAVACAYGSNVRPTA